MQVATDNWRNHCPGRTEPPLGSFSPNADHTGKTSDGAWLATCVSHRVSPETSARKSYFQWCQFKKRDKTL